QRTANVGTNHMDRAARRHRILDARARIAAWADRSPKKLSRYCRVVGGFLLPVRSGSCVSRSGRGGGTALMLDHIDSGGDQAAQPRCEAGALLRRRPVPRVLLLDEDPTVLTLNGPILQAQGYAVETAASAADAVARLARRTFSAVLADVAVVRRAGS